MNDDQQPTTEPTKPDRPQPTQEEIQVMQSTPFPPVGKDPYREAASGAIN